MGWGRARRGWRSHGKTPAATLVSFPHHTGLPSHGSSASLKELIQILENYRLQTTPLKAGAGAGAWGLGPGCSGELWAPAPYQVVQARRKGVDEKVHDHGTEEGKGNPEGAFRAAPAYF